MSSPAATILIADDDAMVLKFVEMVLSRAGYRVLGAVDAEEAIRLCNGGAERVDLALLDVVMPWMDGPQLYATLSEMYPGLRVLFISGFDDPEVRRRCGEHPALEKPFDSEQLLKSVRELMKRPQTHPA